MATGKVKFSIASPSPENVDDHGLPPVTRGATWVGWTGWKVNPILTQLLQFGLGFRLGFIWIHLGSSLIGLGFTWIGFGLPNFFKFNFVTT